VEVIGKEENFSFYHLDTFFNFIDDKTVIVNPYLFESKYIECLQKNQKLYLDFINQYYNSLMSNISINLNRTFLFNSIKSSGQTVVYGRDKKNLPKKMKTEKNF
jgi:arginine deiminase